MLFSEGVIKMNISKRPSLHTLLPWSLVLVMLILNGVLIVQNLHMRSVIRGDVPQALADGERVSGFTGVDPSGQSVKVSYNAEGPSHIFLFLSPNCPFCKEQLPYWRELIKKVDHEKFSVAILVNDSIDKAQVQTYLAKNGFDSGFDVLFLPANVVKDYKLVGTPITLVVSNDGVVRKHWVGKWDDASLNAASAVFNVMFSNASPSGSAKVTS